MHARMRIKHQFVVPEVYEAKKGIGKIHFHLEEKKADVEAAKTALEKLNAVTCPIAARPYRDDYRVRFIENDAYIQACADKTFVDVTLEQLEYIRAHNWWRNFLEPECVQTWPAWKDLIPFARRINAIVPHLSLIHI